MSPNAAPKLRAVRLEVGGSRQRWSRRVVAVFSSFVALEQVLGVEGFAGTEVAALAAHGVGRAEHRGSRSGSVPANAWVERASWPIRPPSP